MAFLFLQTTKKKFLKNCKSKYLNFMKINVFPAIQQTLIMSYISTIFYLRAKVVMQHSEIYSLFANVAVI